MVVVGRADVVTLASSNSCIQLVDDQVDAAKVSSILDEITGLQAIPVWIIIKEVGVEATTVLLDTALEADPLAMLGRTITSRYEGTLHTKHGMLLNLSVIFPVVFVHVCRVIGHAPITRTV